MFTIERPEEPVLNSDKEEEDGDAPVGRLHERRQRTESEKEQQKIADLVRQEKKQKVEEGLDDLHTKIKKLKHDFAEETGLSERIVNNLADGPQILKSTCTFSTRDALVSKKFEEINSTRAPGNKIKLPEAQRLVTLDEQAGVYSE
ncbi:hypothetical protein HWV62_14090 [Athelia sp. TMB]|nr:hypothetical protein HWV62_14090 [Athelia sp. TMB]